MMNQAKNPNYTQPAQGRTGRLPLATIILGGLALLGVIVICLVLAILGRALWMASRGNNEVLAVAVGLEGPRTLAVYTGNPGLHPFWLPAGVYYVEAMDGDGKVYKGWTELVIAGPDGGDLVDLSRRASSGGRQDEAIANQLETLANFMITVDLAELTYLESASDGFTEPFLAAMPNIEMSDADPFYARLQEIEDQEEEVFIALSAFESRVVIDISEIPVSAEGLLAKGVSPRQRSGVWDKLTSFFSFKDEEDELARQEILAVSAAMTDFEKEEAFFWLRANRIGGAQNYDEFVQKLQAGELDDLTEVRSDLSTGGPYQGVYQTINPDSNRPGGENLHRAGAEMIKRGAELEVEVIKEVLKNAFPGIEKGFEYADKANEWANFVQGMYIDPLGTIKGWTIDKIKGQIQEDIKLDLMSAMPDLDEADAEYLAEKLTAEIIKTQAAMITAVAESQSDIERTVTAARTATMQAMLPPGGLPTTQSSLDLPTAQVEASPEPEITTDPVLEPSPTLTLEPTATLTPEASTTPDAAWVEGFVQSISNQLLAEEYDAIAIAVFTDDLRVCLVGAVANGSNQAQALSNCGAQMSAYQDLGGDWVVRNFSGSVTSSNCEDFDTSGDLSTWNSDMILDVLAAYGMWVMDGDGSGMTWQQTQPLPQEAALFTFSGYAAISDDQVKVSYSGRLNNTASSYLVNPWFRPVTNNRGIEKFFILGMLMPTAGLIYAHRRDRRLSVLTMILLGIVMLPLLTACELEDLENLDIDAEIRGEYTFAKPEDLLLYFQSQAGGQEIWSLGPGSGTITMDIDITIEDQRMQCSSTISVNGSGVLLQDGVVTPADVDFGDQ